MEIILIVILAVIIVSLLGSIFSLQAKVARMEKAYNYSLEVVAKATDRNARDFNLLCNHLDVELYTEREQRKIRTPLKFAYMGASKADTIKPPVSTNKKR